MEEAQAPPEPPEKESEPQSSGVERCGRHPAQLLTGICSSCLMERLSSVRSPAEPEIVEVGTAGAGDGSSAVDDSGKLRKTLMLLFQLDDTGGAAGAAGPPEAAKGPRVAEFEVDPGGGRGGGDRGAKGWKGGSWLRSILPWRGTRRRRKEEEEEPSGPPREQVSVDPGGSGGAHVERKPSFRRSCEWMVCREPSRGGSLEPPRHSWDGSMVGKAFACSFACLDDPPDGAERVRQSNAEEAVAESRAAGAAESRNGGHSVDFGGEGRWYRGRSCGDSAGPEITVAGVGRRRSNRWSRVWDRSITSPLKEFVRKGEHVLERSLSESRKETRRGRNGEAADMDGEIQPGRNGFGSGRASHGAIRSSQAAANGDVHNFRTDWLRNKDCKIGRSRSVHYTSPGNFDNGMLRFYLTPMRSTRTANRGRRRNSPLFGRGLFGFI